MPNHPKRHQSNNIDLQAQFQAKLQALGLHYFVQTLGFDFRNVPKSMLESWGKQLEKPETFLANPELLRAHNAYRKHQHLNLKSPKQIRD